MAALAGIRNLPGEKHEDHRIRRQGVLLQYCLACKHRFPEAVDVIGIARATKDSPDASHDVIYLDAAQWDDASAATARKLCEDEGFLSDMKASMESSTDPSVLKPLMSTYRGSSGPRKIGRNASCPCGSGLKFKRCRGLG